MRTVSYRYPPAAGKGVLIIVVPAQSGGMEIRMKIVYKLTDDICIGKIYIDEDTSVLFDSERLQTEELGFTLSLGNSLRFMIEASYKTGRLYCMTCFLQGIKVKMIQIKNIQSHRGQVFLKDEDRTKYSGSVYKPYKEVCYYDEQNSFICYGDYYSEYCLVEIATDTYIGICDDRIVVVILKISGIKEKIQIKNNCLIGCN